MKRIIQIFVGVILISSLSSCGYNSMVELDQGVQQSWADVESEYQRRNDLIKNLVATVKEYADFEQETLTKVIEARAKATSINLNVDELTPENLQKFQDAQSQMSGALSRLMVVVERYPDLKANQNFRDLQFEIAGTENRINRARQLFNSSTRNYNGYVNKFPQMIYSGWFGFDDKPYFKSEEGSEKAPDVKDLFKDE